MSAALQELALLEAAALQHEAELAVFADDEDEFFFS